MYLSPILKHLRDELAALNETIRELERVDIGSPPKRRGRPAGAKNKRKPKGE